MLYLITKAAYKNIQCSQRTSILKRFTKYDLRNFSILNTSIVFSEDIIKNCAFKNSNFFHYFNVQNKHTLQGYIKIVCNCVVRKKSYRTIFSHRES